VPLLQIGQDFSETEHPDGKRHEIEPFGQFEEAERVARRTRVDVGANGAEKQAEEDHPQRCHERPVRQHDRGEQTEQHQRCIFGGAEPDGDLCQRLRRHGNDQRGHRPCEEGTERGDDEGWPDLPLNFHPVAVRASAVCVTP